LFPHHWHPHLEFIYVVEGEAMIECGSTPIHVRAGELVVVNSNELHYGRCLSDYLYYYALIADTSLLYSQSVDAAETKFIAPITQNRLLLRNEIGRDERAAACMLAIVRELQHKEFGYELAVKSELYRLLALLLRGYMGTVLSPDAYAERMKNITRFDPVFQYIETNYKEPLTVDQLADMAGLSRFHFSRLFKELCGRSVVEFITMTRLGKADELLRKGALSVSEVAIATGFNDVYYFSRTFKKHKKVTPSSLRTNGLL
jgi:AraC-like DNA-binding protein